EAMERQKAGGVDQVLADEHGRAHQREAAVDEPGDSEAEDRLLEQRGVADDVAEAGAREASGALHLEAAELEVVSWMLELRRLAPAPDLDRVVLGLAVRAV